MEKETKIVNYLTEKYNHYYLEHKKKLELINNNFLYYFSWESEKAFRYAHIAYTINNMLNTINEGKVQDFLVYFSGIRDNYISRLTTRDVVESSSSMITNLCSLWETHARQELLKIVKECIEIYLEN